MQILSEKVVFKNNKTGKIDTLVNSDITGAIWRRVARDYELKLTLKSGHVYKFDGFKEKVIVRLTAYLVGF